MPGIVLATINAKWIHPSLALRLLKANIGSGAAAGSRAADGTVSDCEILEFALRQPLEEKVEPILAARPRILGLSVSVWNHKASLELLRALDTVWRPDGRPYIIPLSTRPEETYKKWAENQEAVQKPIVVLGGPEISRLPEEAEIFRYADYVIRFEGEESFSSLCNEILSGSLPSSGKKTFDGSAVFINRNETRADLSKITSAYHLYTDDDLQRKLVYVEASRGCPFSCEFCQGGMQPVREFPLEPFLDAMADLIERGGRSFKFLDRSFNLNIDRAKKIMEFFLDRIRAAGTGNTAKDRPLCVHFEMVPFHITSELRELIRRFPPGSLRLELGIQTFNRESASLIQRPGGPEEALETLEFLRRETSAIVHADLIAGLPAEDLSSFGAGFDRLWLAMSGKGISGPPAEVPFEIQLGILKGLPGTPIIRHNETHRMKYSVEPPYEVIETGALSAAELARIKNFARCWELTVNRNPFPDLLSRLFPPGENVFDRFMIFADSLLERFGRNWGLDRKDLRAYCEEKAGGK